MTQERLRVMNSTKKAITTQNRCCKKHNKFFQQKQLIKQMQNYVNKPHLPNIT